MCILFVYVNPYPKPGEYRVILASNRDEQYTRPSKPIHQWTTHEGVYGGQDMQPGKEGGTWLAMNHHGRIGVLLNIGQGKEEMAVADPSSCRGLYAVQWVAEMDKDMSEVFKLIKDLQGSRHTAFRLVVIDTNVPKIGVLTYAGKKHGGYIEEFLAPGVHVLGNNAPGVTWNKVTQGKEIFEKIVLEAGSWDDKYILQNKLLDLLGNKQRHWPDEALAEQMKTSDFVAESLSSIFVHIPSFYGTRTHSVILINSENQASFYEKTMEGVPGDLPVAWIENCHEFNLK